MFRSRSIFTLMGRIAVFTYGAYLTLLRFVSPHLYIAIATPNFENRSESLYLIMPVYMLASVEIPNLGYT